jgi:hypothetical protein
VTATVERRDLALVQRCEEVVAVLEIGVAEASTDAGVLRDPLHGHRIHALLDDERGRHVEEVILALGWRKTAALPRRAVALLLHAGERTEQLLSTRQQLAGAFY